MNSITTVLICGVFATHLSHVDICHIVGVVHLCKYWTLVCFLPTVSKCDKSKE